MYGAPQSPDVLGENVYLVAEVLANVPVATVRYSRLAITPSDNGVPCVFAK